MIKLKPCPFCGGNVEIHVHPEWDDKYGVVYGSYIHHEQRVNGMDTGLYSIHHRRTADIAYDVLAGAWNRRINSDNQQIKSEVENEAR